MKCVLSLKQCCTLMKCLGSVGEWKDAIPLVLRNFKIEVLETAISVVREEETFTPRHSALYI